MKSGQTNLMNESYNWWKREGVKKGRRRRRPMWNGNTNSEKMKKKKIFHPEAKEKKDVNVAREKLKRRVERTSKE